jgi:serine/threonine-protein kinase
LKDVFAVQDEISRAIVDTLQLKLASPGRQSRPASANVEAYDFYLQGRYHWSRWRSEGAERAIQYFQQAIQKDPNYAAAYSGLADSYAWMGFFGAMPPNDAMPKARQAALKALSIDDSLAAAHTSLGYVKALHEFDWPGAEREFKRALQLNAGDSDAHFGYGITYLAPIGRLDEAVQEMKIARDLDPLSPIANTYLGLAYHFVGNRPEAAAQLRKALELDPGFVEARLELANLSIDQQDFKEFYSQLDLAKELAPESRTDLMRATGYAIEGKKTEALQLVHKWEKPPNGVFVRSTSIANLYAVLGEKAQMYAWLERAYADRDGMLAFVNLQGFYRPYRSEPRFIALRKKLGFN